MKTRITIAAITLVVLSCASFIAGASGAYAVSARLSHQGRVFAEPSAVVRDGEPASVQVTGPVGYTISLTVTELAADKLEVAVVVDSVHGVIAPTVVVRPGVPASVSVGEVGLSLVVNPRGA